MIEDAIQDHEDIEFESDAYSLEDICRVVVRNDICDAKKEESTVLTQLIICIYQYSNIM